MSASASYLAASGSRRPFSQNIVLSGGSTMFQHFGNRLKRDLKQLVDRRLDASAVASGSVLKVCRTKSLLGHQTHVHFSPLVLRSMSSPTSVNGPYQYHNIHSLTQSPPPRYAVWFGGSLLASLVSCDPHFLSSSADPRLCSPSSTLHATPKRNTTKSAPVSVDAIKSLAALLSITHALCCVSRALLQ